MRIHATRVMLAFLALLGLPCCGETMVILDVDGAPPEAVQLRLRSRLDGVPGKDFLADLPNQRVVVYLPDGATGSLQLEVTGLDKDNCKVAIASLTEEVPRGLRRFLERRVTLDPVSPARCTLTVVLDQGTGSVGSAPVGINCTRSGTPGCEADFGKGELVSLGANPSSARDYPSWNGYCTGPVACTMAMKKSETQHISFLGRSCSADGWCRQSPVVPGVATVKPILNMWPVGRDTAWFSGDAGTVLRCDRALCTKLPSKVTKALESIWAADPNTSWAMGFDGTLAYCDLASGCNPVNTKTSKAILSMWGTDNTNVWAVGDEGIMIKCETKDRISACGGPRVVAGKNLTNLWGTDTAHIWVVGYGGTILLCDGTSASGVTCQAATATMPIQGNPKGIWGLDLKHVWAFGDNMPLVYCDGGVSPPVCTPTTTRGSFYGIWGSVEGGEPIVWFTGVVDSGAASIVQCDLSRGLPQCRVVLSRPDLNRFWSIWGSDSNHIFTTAETKTGAAEQRGLMLRCTKSFACAPVSVGSDSTLWGVAGSDEDQTNVWAFGPDGTILRLQP